MREIKFRAWMPREKRLVYDVEVSPEAGADRVFLDVMFHKTAADGLVWMQFTGLRDKNGKEIYEGDIIGRDWRMFSDSALRLDRAVVAFEGGAFVGRKDAEETNPTILRYFFMVSSSYKIIGNIYETPQLIETPQSLCSSGLAPHDYDVNDQGDQVDLKCRNCGHVKAK
jgi:uncharacterized phage protein (TIGR01671 family)